MARVATANERVWSIPAPRTKGNREHRVPLCRRALEILEEARGGGGCAGAQGPQQIEAAYRRPDLFERPRRLMEDWAAYLAGGSRGPDRPVDRP